MGGYAKALELETNRILRILLKKASEDSPGRTWRGSAETCGGRG